MNLLPYILLITSTKNKIIKGTDLLSYIHPSVCTKTIFDLKTLLSSTPTNCIQTNCIPNEYMPSTDYISKTIIYTLLSHISKKIFTFNLTTSLISKNYYHKIILNSINDQLKFTPLEFITLIPHYYYSNSNIGFQIYVIVKSFIKGIVVKSSYEIVKSKFKDSTNKFVLSEVVVDDPFVESVQDAILSCAMFYKKNGLFGVKIDLQVQVLQYYFDLIRESNGGELLYTKSIYEDEWYLFEHASEDDDSEHVSDDDDSEDDFEDLMNVDEYIQMNMLKSCNNNIELKELGVPISNPIVYENADISMIMDEILEETRALDKKMLEYSENTNKSSSNCLSKENGLIKEIDSTDNIDIIYNFSLTKDNNLIKDNDLKNKNITDDNSVSEFNILSDDNKSKDDNDSIDNDSLTDDKVKRDKFKDKTENNNVDLISKVSGANNFTSKNQADSVSTSSTDNNISLKNNQNVTDKIEDQTDTNESLLSKKGEMTKDKTYFSAKSNKSVTAKFQDSNDKSIKDTAINNNTLTNEQRKSDDETEKKNIENNVDILKKENNANSNDNTEKLKEKFVSNTNELKTIKQNTVESNGDYNLKDKDECKTSDDKSASDESKINTEEKNINKTEDLLQKDLNIKENTETNDINTNLTTIIEQETKTIDLVKENIALKDNLTNDLKEEINCIPNTNKKQENESTAYAQLSNKKQKNKLTTKYNAVSDGNTFKDKSITSKTDTELTAYLKTILDIIKHQKKNFKFSAKFRTDLREIRKQIGVEIFSTELICEEICILNKSKKIKSLLREISEEIYEFLKVVREEIEMLDLKM